jgi:hypothetical protein
MSKIAYVELVGKSADPIFKHKIVLENGMGSGDFFIPTSVPSGAYKLLAYTRWMQNGPISDFFQGELTVVNPYQVELGELQPISSVVNDSLKEGGEKKLQRPVSLPYSKITLEQGPVRLSMASQNFGKRERVFLTLHADENKMLAGNYSVSVRKIDGIVAPPQPRFVDFAVNSIQKDAELPNIGDEVYLPELRGELFEGKVEALNANRPVKGLKVGISIPGADYYFNVANTDSRGAFYFNVDTFYSGDEVVFQVFGKNSGEYKISLITPSNLDYSRLDFKTVPLQPSFTEEIRHRSIHNQIENSFFQFRPDSIKTSITSQIFDDKEKEVYLLDDYTRFKTVRETVIEIIKDVSLERIAKDKYVINVKGFNYTSPAGYLPLILLDGGIVTNHEALLEYDARTVEEIMVLRHGFTIGPELYEGAFIIKTEKGNGYESFKTGSDASIMEIFKPQPKKKYYMQHYGSNKMSSRLPDDRLQLLWVPNLEFKDKETTLNFFTSDVPGEFEISIEGLTDEKLPVSIQKSIFVN